VAVLAALVVSNVMSNRVLPGWSYVPWNTAVAAALVLLARPVVTPQQMGLTRWRSGAAWGAVLFVLTAGVLLLGLTMPVFHEMFHDRRVEGGTGTWLYQVFVRIPFGTALLEEVAYRGVCCAATCWRRAASDSGTCCRRWA
jgi:uncharacterized protein